MIKTDLKNIYLAAIVKDHGWDVKVYIINTSDKPLPLKLLRGSFEGDMDGVSSLGHSRYKDEVIPANSFLQIDHMDDAGQLDFTTFYTLKVGAAYYFEQIGGSVVREASWVDIPVLNQRGSLRGFAKIRRPTR